MADTLWMETPKRPGEGGWVMGTQVGLWEHSMKTPVDKGEGSKIGKILRMSFMDGP